MMQLAHFADYADAWLLSLQQQGKSAHTLAAYRRDLAQLVQLLPQERHSESPQRRHFVAALKKLSKAEKEILCAAWRAAGCPGVEND